jgi:hypothetical protein
MKFSVAAILALPAVVAFQAPRPAFASTTSQLSATVLVTGLEGKAASSFEEDLALTLQIILDHEMRSTTVSNDQSTSQEMQEVAEIEKEPENIAPVDVLPVEEKAAGAANENKPAAEENAAKEIAVEKKEPAEAKAAEAAKATTKKESQVAEGPKTPSIGNGEAASSHADMVTCSVCAVPKAKSNYTKTQLKKKTFKCMECVAKQTSSVTH